jgi:hypothetical protein
MLENRIQHHGMSQWVLFVLSLLTNFATGV